MNITIEYLLELPNARAHINDRNSKGDTLLIYLMDKVNFNVPKYVDLFDLLLKYGADINLKNNNNKSCMDIAVRDYNSMNSKNIISFLESRGAKSEYHVLSTGVVEQRVLSNEYLSSGAPEHQSNEHQSNEHQSNEQ